jgi:hypothetical protein
MGRALVIRDDLSAGELRCYARREPNRRAALRMLAIAGALGGLSRAEAARLVGMERQALRDAVVRYNAEGLSGLYDRPPRKVGLKRSVTRRMKRLASLCSKRRSPGERCRSGNLWRITLRFESALRCASRFYASTS